MRKLILFFFTAPYLFPDHGPHFALPVSLVSLFDADNLEATVILLATADLLKLNNFFSLRNSFRY